MSDDNINDLPPDSVSTQQLLIMVRDLRADQRAMRDTMNEWRRETHEALVGVRSDMQELSQTFEQGKATIRILKWLAALAVGAIALYEALKRIT